MRTVGRDSATDGDQCGEADQRQRLRIELSTPETVTVGVSDAGVVDGKPAQPFRVVQGAHPSTCSDPAIPIIDAADSNRITKIV